MDIHAYIQSGVIETYVLGLASAEESADVERLRKQYIEVENAINEFSQSLEKYAAENAVTPPSNIKTNIFAALKDEFHGNEHFKESHALNTQPTAAKVRDITSWRIAVAASAILLVASAGLNFYFYGKYRDKQDQYQALLSERETLQANNQFYQTQLKEWQTAAAMMGDTVMTTIKMHSPKGSDDAATVFWNSRNKDVFVMVNKLPEPKSGKQYQLWALVDGKPVDAGVLNPSCTSVCKMKNITKAQAFAITLEKEGGNQTPNLKALYVIGNI